MYRHLIQLSGNCLWSRQLSLRYRVAVNCLDVVISCDWNTNRIKKEREETDSYPWQSTSWKLLRQYHTFVYTIIQGNNVKHKNCSVNLSFNLMVWSLTNFYKIFPYSHSSCCRSYSRKAPTFVQWELFCCKPTNWRTNSR